MSSRLETKSRTANVLKVRIKRCDRQCGVTLLEVLITLFILTFGALAIANLQTASSIGVQGSADHFTINELGQIIVEQLKADSGRAAAGAYNTDYAEAQAPASASTAVAKKINAWKTTMSSSTPKGETRINCDTDTCTISLKWYELSHDGVFDQYFNLKIPI